MTKPLCRYVPEIRNEVIKRRIQEKSMGLGYWSAVDAMFRTMKAPKALLQILVWEKGGKKKVSGVKEPLPFKQEEQK